ncbi:MAG: DUF2254 domain-containing protein [Anaerolineae bacterium]|nr:DUF2254 domain-containing protein [Anaerolineae bacterium]
MRVKIAHTWGTLRNSFWFLPLELSVMTALLSLGMVALDRYADWDTVYILSWFYRGSPDGARAILSTIGGSMIGVAGTVFSITIAVLSFASSTFGARLLRNFMRDRGNQLVLGTFVATFLYCLLVLRAVRGADEGAFVPHLSVTMGILLAIASLGALIYFIHHISESIQAGKVIADVGHDLMAAIDAFFPERVERSMPAEDGGVATTLSQMMLDAAPIPARQSGYVQAVNAGHLLQLAMHHDLRLSLHHRPGDFVIEGHALAHVSPADRLTPRLIGDVNDDFILGPERTPTQGVEFALNQLVEIALRALSPSINDPFTAMACIDWLGAGLFQVSERQTPSPYHHDRAGYVRLFTRPVTFAGLVDTAFGQIRQAARSNVAVIDRLLETLAVLISHVRKEEQRQALLIQAEAAYRGLLATGLEACDEKDIERRFLAVQQAAHDVGSPPRS